MAAQPDPGLAGVRAIVAGDPIAVRAAAEEGRDLADAIGDGFNSRQCRVCLVVAQICRANWPEPSHNSAWWRPRPRPLTMGTAGCLASGTRACTGVAG